MIESLIAQGGTQQLNRLGNTISGVGQSIQRNRLLDLQEKKQAVDQQRQTVLNNREDVEAKRKFEADLVLELSNTSDERLLPTLQSRAQEAQQLGLDPADILEDMQAIQSGGLAQFRQELEEGVNFLRSNGTIKAPSGTTKLEKLFAFKETLDPNDSRLAQVDAAIEKESRSSPLVSINNEAEEKGLTEEKKALAKSRVSRFESILDQADNAITQDEQLAQLENIDISTGFGTEAKGALASAINAFSPGAGDELLNTDVDALQAFKGVSSRLVNSELNKAKGPQTEGDAKRAQSTLASLTNQNAANKFLVQSLRATNARMIEQSEFYQSVLERDGSLKKADSEWLAFKRSTPMLSDSVRDAETGLPMFYRDFKLKTQERNPGVTDEQILTAWRGMQE